MTKPIVNLCAFDPNWEAKFEYEKSRIVHALKDKIISIEHIGSTSINGLEAKPIIDIMVGVKDLNEVPTFFDTLAEVDYEHVPKVEFKDRRFFRKGLWGQGTSHLHVCEFNSDEWLEKILFRDYLRQHPDIAEQYAILKRTLATEHKEDRSTYTKRKEPFIRMVIEQAWREIESEE
ncbi:GrpB domain, predicted nucleotidyltransferase, UPF0157 family [Oceanobacillus limi]|uniref:GrpB domain, predicted nucleotidyltransferase, UPF0157 family n=1 Tax=Oceanobacillus limi TaxID=930131 RepID=A0A1I0GJQ6_9BACI|nr:GrpB family protein [Oceanobacillus limi]SET71384.1 GrpB domain, predicted nucleotidyltransferase, UPF0157 family [Oceanobacillus limi]